MKRTTISIRQRVAKTSLTNDERRYHIVRNRKPSRGRHRTFKVLVIANALEGGNGR